MSRRPSRRKQVPIRSRASAASAVASAVASDEPLANLKGVELKRATDGQTVDAASIVPSSGRVMVPFLTQFADFDSWELAQKLVDDIPELDANGVTLVAVGIGSVEAAKEFSLRTNFPLDRLYADETAAAYQALDFAPGFGRAGGKLGWIGEKLPFVNGYAKLLVMCAGLARPAPWARSSAATSDPNTGTRSSARGSNYDNPTIRKLMDATLGGGYQRPFELATLRLTNMTEILSNWEDLAPADDNLLVQRGGSLVFQDGACVFRHNDAGILGYCPEERLVTKALSDDPAAPPDAVATLTPPRLTAAPMSTTSTPPSRRWRRRRRAIEGSTARSSTVSGDWCTRPARRRSPRTSTEPGFGGVTFLCPPCSPSTSPQAGSAMASTSARSSSSSTDRSCGERSLACWSSRSPG